MHQEKYSLTWQTYSDHLKSMMKELMMNEDFSDVTLVTEDKKHIKANIAILSACSPVFKDVLKKEKNFSPIMYLRGIQYSELESIMQFIYLGEATFYEERMDEFLAVAKSLEIKELCNAETETTDKPEDTVPIDPDSEMVKEDYFLSEDIIGQPQQKRKREVLSENGKYKCDQCQNEYSTSSGLNYHKQTEHEGVKYACDQCDKQFTRQGSLAEHIKSKHEGIKYACEQCHYQATKQSNLTRHIKFVHKF